MTTGRTRMTTDRSTAWRLPALLLAVALVAAGVYAALDRAHPPAAADPAGAAGAAGPVATLRGPDRGAALAGSRALGAPSVLPAAGAGAGATPAGAARRAQGTLSPNREAFEKARNLGALFNALIVSTDPDALFFAERALRECMPYIMAAGQSSEAPPLDKYRPARADDPLTARRQQAYGALQARCSGFDLGADPPATRKALHDALLATSDPRAALEQASAALRKGAAPEGAMDRTRELAATGDPYLLEQASAAMSAMRGRYVFMVDGQLVRPDIVAAGWMMAACDAGRSCGAEWVDAPCAFLTECDARDLESSMQRYQLTPLEYERMQQVRALVTRGVASGQWDPALFAPQPPPPGYRRWGP